MVEPFVPEDCLRQPLNSNVRRLLLMGHSFVEVGDRGAWLNDGHLTLIRHFIEREGRRLLAGRGSDAALQEAFEQFLEGFAD